MKKVVICIITLLLISLAALSAADLSTASLGLLWKPNVEITGNMWFTDSEETTAAVFPLKLADNSNVATVSLKAKWDISPDIGFTLKFTLGDSFGKIDWSATFDGESPTDKVFEKQITSGTTDKSVDIVVTTNELTEIVTDGSSTITMTIVL